MGDFAEADADINPFCIGGGIKKHHMLHPRRDNGKIPRFEGMHLPAKIQDGDLPHQAAKELGKGMGMQLMPQGRLLLRLMGIFALEEKADLQVLYRYIFLIGWVNIENHRLIIPICAINVNKKCQKKTYKNEKWLWGGFYFEKNYGKMPQEVIIDEKMRQRGALYFHRREKSSQWRGIFCSIKRRRHYARLYRIFRR